MSLFSTLGKIAGVVGSVLPGPIGTVAKTVGGALAGTAGTGTFSGNYLPTVLKSNVPQALPGGAKLQDPGKPSIFTQGLPSIDSVKVTQSGAGLGPLGGFIGSQTATFYPTTQNGSCGASSRGTHLNRTGYFLKNGQYIAPGTKCVTNRRRNPLNPRALSRAMSRLSSAKKAVKALDRFEIKGRRR